MTNAATTKIEEATIIGINAFFFFLFDFVITSLAKYKSSNEQLNISHNFINWFILGSEVPFSQADMFLLLIDNFFAKPI